MKNFSLQDLTNRLNHIAFSNNNNEIKLEGTFKLDINDNNDIAEVTSFLNKWYSSDITDKNIKKYKINNTKWVFEDILGGIRILKLNPDTCEIEVYSNGKGKLNQVYFILTKIN